ncbi:sugar phosphate isomerase/epimerase family protein [Halobacillus sp. K22]|uniref:sugar phosphate isomerase/epimerase family protein n=1 Tax=Halobacillus sp. K22 TaxID=3457431 RepID=UPI003FCC93CD
MRSKLGISGSTILSDPDQFDQLFKTGIHHIEIGEFPDKASFYHFLQMAKQNKVSFGIHSPLIRGNSKYDLIDYVSMDPGEARKNFEKEVALAASVGAEYILVHFPYFKGSVSSNPRPIIEEGLRYLSELQERYKISIVCEPKLGLNRSPAGIHYLQQFPKKVWETYQLSICIDMGDYRMAAGDKWKEYIVPLLPYTTVVHVHNVSFSNNKYYWVPIHPGLNETDGHYDMKSMIEILSERKGRYFILEHTPHSRPSDSYVDEGLEWIRNLIG